MNTNFEGLEHTIQRDNRFILPAFKCGYCSLIFNNLKECREHVDICICNTGDGMNVPTDKAKSDREEFSLDQIPFTSLKRIGKVFKEGEMKYGRGNWRNGVGDREYQLERLNHAIKHLMIYAELLETGHYLGEMKEGEIEKIEDDLAKVAWFCVTQMEIERLEEKLDI